MAGRFPLYTDNDVLGALVKALRRAMVMGKSKGPDADKNLERESISDRIHFVRSRVVMLDADVDGLLWSVHRAAARTCPQEPSISHTVIVFKERST